MGRPVKLTAQRRSDYLQQVSEGLSRTEAAEAVGVHPCTVRRHATADPAFAEAIDAAEAEALDRIEGAMYQAALSGNVQAGQWILQNRRPDRWKSERALRLEVDVANAARSVTGLVTGLREAYERGELD